MQSSNGPAHAAVHKGANHAGKSDALGEVNEPTNFIDQSAYYLFLADASQMVESRDSLFGEFQAAFHTSAGSDMKSQYRNIVGGDPTEPILDETRTIKAGMDDQDL